MKTVTKVFLIVILLIVLAGVGFFVLGYFAPKPGGIRIETSPESSVYVNGSLVGETPYKGSFKAEKINLRLIPHGDVVLPPFETSLTLTPGVETAVGREFGESESDSSGYVVSFEKSKKTITGFVAISIPDNAQVVIDGVSRGFSTYETSTIAPAMHTVIIKSPGYEDFMMNVKTLSGYRMTFYAKLSKEKNIKNTDELPETPTKTVKILDTSTGFLRVRTLPGSGGAEIAQVKPGEEYPYLDTDVESGWIQIQYQASKSGMPSGIVGWISGDFASVSSGLKQP